MSLVSIGRLRPENTANVKTSPDWVRISYASALALRFKSGRFSPPFEFGGINLLLSYDEGCQSDCGYCGLARSRAGDYEDKSFIRVDWPLVETEELVARFARFESRLTRLCISMVTHGRAFADTLEIAGRIRSRVDTPLSILVAPPTLNRQRLADLRDAGADMIGIGLDTVTEDLFRSLRSAVPRGGLDWSNYWQIVDDARDLYGPWKINCHTLVGVGESDRDLMELFARLLERQIFSYLFCFNPEPDSRLADRAKTSLRRWRRVQLAKFLLEESGLPANRFSFDPAGRLERIHAPRELVDRVLGEGRAFMTNGCPGPAGEPGCTRPMGSWRPDESPRDYPWTPSSEERRDIRRQLDLGALLRPAPWPASAASRLAPPAAGRPV